MTALRRPEAARRLLASTIDEEGFLAHVVELCRLQRVPVFHARPARRLGGRWWTPTQGDPGFPDLVVVGARPVFAELKTERGRLSASQRRWLGALTEAGAWAVVWRPRHLAEIWRFLSRERPVPPGLDWGGGSDG